MAEYILLLKGGPGDLQRFSPQEIQTMIEKYDRWFQGLAATGRLKSADKLKFERGRRIRGYGDAQVVTDGPFAETSELIGGVFHIEAASYEEAVDIVRTSPQLEYGGTIDVREVDCLEEERAAADC